MSLFDCLLLTAFNVVICITLPKLISLLSSLSTPKTKEVSSIGISSPAITTPEV